MEIFDQDIPNAEERNLEKPILAFVGDPIEYLGIFYTNLFLNILTLGFYYPWSKVKSYKYFFNNTQLNGTGFQFHGTGKELLKGFLIFAGFILFLIGLYAGAIYLAVKEQVFWVIGIAVIVYLLAFASIFPFAMHRRMKYLSGRTTWRGVQWGFNGNLKKLFKRYFLDILAIVFTFGIYIFWFKKNNIQYRIDNLKLGNIWFKFKGEGGELFFVYLVIGFNLMAVFGIILLPISLILSIIDIPRPELLFNVLNYIIAIVFSPLITLKYMLEYYFNNTRIHQDDKMVSMYVKFPILSIVQKLSKTFLLTIVTFGIYAPVFGVEMYKYFLEGVKMKGELYMSDVQQTQEEYNENTGETLGDFLDLDII